RGWLLVISTIYSFAILSAFIRWRWAMKLRNWAERVSRRRFLQALIVVPLFAASFTILRLPHAMYGHHVSLKFGLSVQGWGSWLRDWATQLALIAAVGTVVVWIFFLIVTRSPRRGGVFFLLAILPVSAFFAFFSALPIHPLFFNFWPFGFHKTSTLH